MKIDNVEYNTCYDTSFYHIFDFNHLMHDAIDGGLVYDNCKITKDINTVSGELKEGQEFHQVNFYFNKQAFHFINWKLDLTPGGNGQYIPNETSVLIPQAEISKYLVW